MNCQKTLRRASVWASGYGRTDETSTAPGTIVIFGGDIAIFRSWMIRDIVATGWRVIACGPEDADQAESIARLGAEYIAVATDRTGMNAPRDLKSILSLARTLSSLDPDIFFSFHTKYNVIGPIAARLAKVPGIYALIAGLGYAFSPGKEFKRIAVRAALSGLLRVSLRCCNGVFVQNRDDLNLVRGAGWVPRSTPIVKLAGTGVDVDAFAYTPPEVGPLRVLLIARLLREKGVADYVEAARLVKHHHPECSFALLGPFESNPSAIRPDMVEAWHQEGVITYLGKANDVRPHLQTCSILALPSYYREGIPKTILEAMAIGRAVVTCDVPGCREAVSDGVNGFLVPPRNPAALAAAIERFCHDPVLITTMGQASRHFAQTQFDVRKVNAMIMAAMNMGSV